MCDEADPCFAMGVTPSHISLPPAFERLAAIHDCDIAAHDRVPCHAVVLHAEEDGRAVSLERTPIREDDSASPED